MVPQLAPVTHHLQCIIIRVQRLRGRKNTTHYTPTSGFDITSVAYRPKPAMASQVPSGLCPFFFSAFVKNCQQLLKIQETIVENCEKL